MASEPKKKKKKGFTDYQESEFLPDFFKYVPDAYQVSDYLKGILSRDKPPENIDGKAIKGKTRGR